MSLDDCARVFSICYVCIVYLCMYLYMCSTVGILESLSLGFNSVRIPHAEQDTLYSISICVCVYMCLYSMCLCVFSQCVLSNTGNCSYCIGVQLSYIAYMDLYCIV